MPNINGLLEAALFVENLSRACDFYQQVVGLESLVFGASMGDQS
jgi:predicted enzyme related to lactoylglutathione lyase